MSYLDGYSYSVVLLFLLFTVRINGARLFSLRRRLVGIACVGRILIGIEVLRDLNIV